MGFPALKWKDVVLELGAEGLCCRKLLMLCGFHTSPALVRSVKRGLTWGWGTEKFRAPPDLHGQFGVEQWLQAALLCHCFGAVQGQLVLNRGMRRSCATRPQEMNVWPEAAFWQDVGPEFLGFILTVYVNCSSAY